MKSVHIGDIDMQVLDEGSGVPLLMVHGFPLNHTMWRAQLDEFVPHCRVIVPDLRGLGRTPLGAVPTIDRSGDPVVSMEHHADDLNRLLDALHIDHQVIFCGLSMGGYIGWQFTQKYPDRLLALIACDTRAVADSTEQAAARMKLAAQIREQGVSAAADAMLPKLVSQKTKDQRPELVEQLRQMILQNSPEGVLASLHGLRTREDMTESLSQIPAETLLVVGEEDALAPPAEMEGLVDLIPTVNWLVVPDAGHMSPMENSTVFNQALMQYITR
ncbi:MAG: alpha/beta fold hydrolase [Planctomycetota bacterium]|nr:alpha/beta fold hydrolase [Planctomycetota bacterium]